MAIAAAGCHDREETISVTRQAAMTPLAAWAQAEEAKIPPAALTKIKPHASATERVVHAVHTIYPPDFATAIYRVVVIDEQTGESRKFSVNANSGAQVDLAQHEQTAAAMRRGLHGALTPELHELIAPMPPTDQVAVIITLEGPQLPPRPLLPTPTARAIYSQQVKSAVAAQVAPILTQIAQHGGSVVWTSESAPTIRAKLPAGELLTHFAQQSSIGSIEHDVPRIAQAAVGQSNTDLNITPVFHAFSLYGQGVRVGMIDTFAAKCTNGWFPLWTFASWTNHVAPRACTSDANCTPCNQQIGPAVCRTGSPNNGTCAAQHPTAVAGVLGHVSASFANLHAPQVMLFMANNNVSFANDLAWLWSQDVQVANNSTAAYQSSYDADYYSILGLASSTAAGNYGPGAGTNCWDSSGLCVAGYVTPTSFDGRSSTANHADCNGHIGCDREDPTVTFKMTMTTTGNTQTWITPWGTSFASPAAAALMALERIS